MKQAKPILVILGNPPYDGYAGVAEEQEERELTNAYRAVKRVRPPEGQGLNDLYVRFFRMAERRITEKTGEGVVCFISNYSWLDGLSFPGMREHYLEVFDDIRIDCLNGDIRKGGKTPDGLPDASIFTVKGSASGIQVGTAIATLIRKSEHTPAGNNRLPQSLGTEQTRAAAGIFGNQRQTRSTKTIEPVLPFGLPFTHTTSSDDWLNWPSLSDLFPTSYPGVQTKRDQFLVDIDPDRLKERISEYFDPGLSNEKIARLHPSAMKSSSGFTEPDARKVRNGLLERGGPDDAGFVKYTYRPFDPRSIYWDDGRGLLGRPAPDYRLQTFGGNLFIEARARETIEGFSRGTLVRGLADNFGNGFSNFFPLWIREIDGGNDSGITKRANLTKTAQRYLKHIGADAEDLFYHALATLHDPAYREDNAGALRVGWPRIPLPGWPDKNSRGAADALVASANRGRQLADLLDPETSVTGVTKGDLREEIAGIAIPARRKGGSMSGDDFLLTANWGRFGANMVVMPGNGKNQGAQSHIGGKRRRRAPFFPFSATPPLTFT